jgi:hypothetical protein
MTILFSNEFFFYPRRREARMQNLGQAETKLLYTLHWIILDAIEECADADKEKDAALVEKRGPFFYLFPLHCIQVSPRINSKKN